MLDYLQILKEILIFLRRLGHGQNWVFWQDNKPQKGGQGASFEITFPQSNLL